jgi:signal transduction histidine kinase
MNTRPMLSLVPIVVADDVEHTDVSFADAVAELGSAVAILLPVARALAGSDAIPADVRRRHAVSLAADNAALRRQLAHALDGEPLDADDDEEPSSSSSCVRSSPVLVSRPPGREGPSALQLAILESLVDGLDLASAAATVSRCAQFSEGEGARAIAAAFELAANLLDLALARDRSLTVPLRRVSLVQIVEHVTRACWPLARVRGVDIRCSIGAPVVFADRDMLVRALTTLLHEAILSAPERSVVRFEISRARPAELRVGVEGALRSREARSGSAGLELAFCRAAAAAHGSELGFDERRGWTEVGFALARTEPAMLRAA